MMVVLCVAARPPFAPAPFTERASVGRTVVNVGALSYFADHAVFVFAAPAGPAT